MDYNTYRDKLILPEYGRHVQKMIERAKGIEDRQKRSEQIQAVVNVMVLLNPSLKEFPDYKRKLWDHVYVIAGYDLDIDSPFGAPQAASAASRPEPIPVEKRPIKASCYGRNIENMIDLVSGIDDAAVRTEMIRNLARYMRQQYLIWNKDTVADETILKDMVRLADGKITIPEGLELGAVHGEFNRPRPFDARSAQQFGKKRGKKKHKSNF